MATGYYSLLSPLHDAAANERVMTSFVSAIEKELDDRLVPISLEQLRESGLTLLSVQSGGVEEQFKELLPSLQGPCVLLASGFSNSLAASLEILAFLKQHGLKGEILHGRIDDIAVRLKTLKTIADARKRLSGTRLGVIGRPSGWLIASLVDYKKVKDKFGIELVDIDIEEFFHEMAGEAATTSPSCTFMGHNDSEAMAHALRAYSALRQIIKWHRLQGLTLRCFDMLERFKSTGCMALALLNSEGIPSACEGDVPSLLSMVILNYLAHEPVFMANPSAVDCRENTVVLAHCTVPLSMVASYGYDTHFESSLGIAVKGTIPAGRGTLFRLASDLSHYYLSAVDVLHSMKEPELCRTQIKVKPHSHVSSFLTAPMGNHHLYCHGDHESLVRELMA